MVAAKRKQKNPKKRQTVKRKGGDKRSHRRRSCPRARCAKNKAHSFRDIVGKVKKRVLQHRPKNLHNAVVLAAKMMEPMKRKNVNTPRIIRIPKTGGILPLIPIFAGLSALGALSGGAAGIAKAVNDAQAAKRQLSESQRHNETMESIAIGHGKGLHLKPYKRGLGLFLHPAVVSNNFR